MKLKEWIAKHPRVKENLDAFKYYISKYSHEPIAVIIKHRTLEYVIHKCGREGFALVCGHPRPEFDFQYIGKAGIKEKNLMESFHSTVLFKDEELYKEFVGTLVLEAL